MRGLKTESKMSYTCYPELKIRGLGFPKGGGSFIGQEWQIFW